MLWAAGIAVAASAVFAASAADADSGYDLLHLAQAVGADLLRLSWPLLLLVIALAGLHYLATAYATRAASGLRLPIGETVLVQLAAAAANRISAAGLGGSAVNARYFSRRGLTLPAAVGAVAALGLFGGVADLLVLLIVLALGSWIGLPGGASEVSLLASRLAGILAPLASVWLWVALAVLAVAAWWVRVRLRTRAAAALRSTWAPVRSLVNSPRRLAVLLVASAATTLVLAAAFVASVSMVPGSALHVGVGALVVGFMLGAAAGNAVPVPAGVGSTETALITLLVTNGLGAAQAVEIVIIYRAITFWAPPLIGLVTARALHRAGAL